MQSPAQTQPCLYPVGDGETAHLQCQPQRVAISPTDNKTVPTLCFLPTCAQLAAQSSPAVRCGFLLLCRLLVKIAKCWCQGSMVASWTNQGQCTNVWMFQMSQMHCVLSCRQQMAGYCNVMMAKGFKKGGCTQLVCCQRLWFRCWSLVLVFCCLPFVNWEYCCIGAGDAFRVRGGLTELVGPLKFIPPNAT